MVLIYYENKILKSEGYYMDVTHKIWNIFVHNACDILSINHSEIECIVICRSGDIAFELIDLSDLLENDEIIFQIKEKEKVNDLIALTDYQKSCLPRLKCFCQSSLDSCAQSDSNAFATEDDLILSLHTKYNTSCKMRLPFQISNKNSIDSIKFMFQQVYRLPPSSAIMMSYSYIPLPKTINQNLLISNSQQISDQTKEPSYSNTLIYDPHTIDMFVKCKMENNGPIPNKIQPIHVINFADIEFDITIEEVTGYCSAESFVWYFKCNSKEQSELFVNRNKRFTIKKEYMRLFSVFPTVTLQSTTLLTISEIFRGNPQHVIEAFLTSFGVNVTFISPTGTDILEGQSDVDNSVSEGEVEEAVTATTWSFRCPDIESLTRIIAARTINICGYNFDLTTDYPATASAATAIPTSQSEPLPQATIASSPPSVTHDLYVYSQVVESGEVSLSVLDCKELLIIPLQNTETYPHHTISVFIASTGNRRSSRASFSRLEETVRETLNIPKYASLSLYCRRTERTISTDSDVVSLTNGTELLLTIAEPDDSPSAADVISCQVSLFDNYNPQEVIETFVAEVPASLSYRGLIHYIKWRVCILIADYNSDYGSDTGLGDIEVKKADGSDVGDGVLTTLKPHDRLHVRRAATGLEYLMEELEDFPVEVEVEDMLMIDEVPLLSDELGTGNSEEHDTSINIVEGASSGGDEDTSVAPTGLQLPKWAGVKLFQRRCRLSVGLAGVLGTREAESLVHVRYTKKQVLDLVREIWADEIGTGREIRLLLEGVDGSEFEVQDGRTLVEAAESVETSGQTHVRLKIALSDGCIVHCHLVNSTTVSSNDIGSGLTYTLLIVESNWAWQEFLSAASKALLLPLNLVMVRVMGLDDVEHLHLNTLQSGDNLFCVVDQNINISNSLDIFEGVGVEESKGGCLAEVSAYSDKPIDSGLAVYRGSPDSNFKRIKDELQGLSNLERAVRDSLRDLGVDIKQTALHRLCSTSPNGSSFAPAAVERVVHYYWEHCERFQGDEDEKGQQECSADYGDLPPPAPHSSSSSSTSAVKRAVPPPAPPASHPVSPSASELQSQLTAFGFGSSQIALAIRRGLSLEEAVEFILGGCVETGPDTRGSGRDVPASNESRLQDGSWEEYCSNLSGARPYSARGVNASSSFVPSTDSSYSKSSSTPMDYYQGEQYRQYQPYQQYQQKYQQQSPLIDSSYGTDLSVSMTKNHIARRLIEIGYEASEATRASQRCSSVEAAVEYLLRGQCETTETPPNLMCALCQDSVPVPYMYTLDCPQSHKYCVGCMVLHMASSMRKSDDSSPHLPACPEANGKDGCRHLMSQQELEEVLELAELFKRNKQAEIDLSVPQLHQLMDTGRALYLAKAHREMGHVRCVGCGGANDEGFWFALPEYDYCQDVGQFVKCPRCKIEFCGRCRSRPYHFGCSCDEVLELARKWMRWTESGRDAYMAELQNSSQEYDTLLSQYREQKEQFDREGRAARERHQELLENETWKAQHCKLCPNCNRVVEKIDGCDLMVCGRNYHGGDVQMGCGIQFGWQNAPAYVVDAGQVKEVVLEATEPEVAQMVRHMIAEGFPMRCDICDKNLVGPRIRCVNCRCFNMCLRCSMTDAGHDRDHTCEVIFEDPLFA